MRLRDGARTGGHNCDGMPHSRGTDRSLSRSLTFAASASKLKPVAGTVALIAAYAFDQLGSIPGGELATHGIPLWVALRRDSGGRVHRGQSHSWACPVVACRAGLRSSLASGVRCFVRPTRARGTRIRGSTTVPAGRFSLSCPGCKATTANLAKFSPEMRMKPPKRQHHTLLFRHSLDRLGTRRRHHSRRSEGRGPDSARRAADRNACAYWRRSAEPGAETGSS